MSERRVIGRLLTVPALVLAAVASLTLGALVWCAITAHSDVGLVPPEHGRRVLSRELPGFPGRRVHQIRLQSQALGDMTFDLSLPQPLPSDRLPVVLLVGGRQSGAALLDMLGPPGNNAVAIFEWPTALQMARGFGFWRLFFTLPRMIPTLPGQISTVMDWLVTQPWAAPRRLSLLGFSLGAEAVPAAADLAASAGHPAGWMVLAYGGAPLSVVMREETRIRPTWFRHLLANLLAPVLKPCEPIPHLRRLAGPFLVLEGRDDRIIPASARAALWDAVPEPKVRLLFEGDHFRLHASDSAFVQRIVAASATWLVAQHAINPFGGSAARPTP